VVEIKPNGIGANIAEGAGLGLGFGIGDEVADFIFK
jgi:hypothetical protein